MPAVLSQNNCQYTPLTTAGTYTVAQGGTGQVPSGPQVFFGVSCVAFGTTPSFTAFDVVPPNPGQVAAGTSTQTFTLLSGTFTAAGQSLGAGVGSCAVRFRGNLVIVTAGTANTLNALWD